MRASGGNAEWGSPTCPPLRLCEPRGATDGKQPPRKPSSCVPLHVDRGLETQRRERIRVKVRKWRSQHITGRIDVQSGRFHLRGNLTYRLLRHARLVVVSGEEGVPAEQVGKAPYGSYDLGVCRKDRSKHALCLFDCLRRPVRSIGRASDFRRGWTRPLRLCCGVMVLRSAFLMGMA